MTPAAHLAYAALWASFGLGHSLFAGATRRAGLGRTFGGGHRLAYNAIAAIHIAAVYGIGRFILARHDPSWPISSAGRAVAISMAVVGAVILLLAVARYDRGSFLGTAQLRGGADDGDAPLNTAGLNRYVRHPLYFGGLLLLWSGATSDFGLATAIWGSLYIVIGSRLEERRLLARFGAAYADYRRRVPGLLPWRAGR